MTQIEYVHTNGKLWDGLAEGATVLGFDEPLPMNISRALWVMSQWSQRQFEANLLVYGKN